MNSVKFVVAITIPLGQNEGIRTAYARLCKMFSKGQSWESTDEAYDQRGRRISIDLLNKVRIDSLKGLLND